jgi:broad specificity phosphatase PhoE
VTFGSHDEPLDERGREDATRLQLHRSVHMSIAPDASAREAAMLMGADGEVDPRLRAIDLGRWAGRRPDEVDARELEQWFTDPDAVPHGGESITDFVGRLAKWLDDCRGDHLAVVVAGGTAQGIVAAAIGARFFGLEVQPADSINLRRSAGSWHLRLGQQNW